MKLSGSPLRVRDALARASQAWLSVGDLIRLVRVPESARPGVYSSLNRWHRLAFVERRTRAVTTLRDKVWITRHVHNLLNGEYGSQGWDE